MLKSNDIATKSHYEKQSTTLQVNARGSLAVGAGWVGNGWRDQTLGTADCGPSQNLSDRAPRVSAKYCVGWLSRLGLCSDPLFRKLDCVKNNLK